mmetsp:Transcript_16703/g.21729  ORF Transcript_16703/g.21729 Transcript_16703/m.21729 type:complete len:424 (-) Transcript_16703:2126-3397(-)
MRAGFHTWVIVIEYYKHVNHILTRTCRHWQQIALAYAFETWRSLVKHEIQLQLMAKRLLCHMLHFRISRAFQVWLFYAMKQKTLDQCLRQVFARAGTRWALGKLAISFSTWLEYIDYQQHVDILLTRICRHWQQLSLGSAFMTWKYQAYRLMRLEYLVLRVWRDHEIMKKEALFKWKLHTRLAKTQIQFLSILMRRNNLLNAFDAWRLRSKALHRIEIMVRSCCRRDILFALGRWVQKIHFLRKVEKRRQSALRPILYAWPLLKAWRTWRTCPKYKLIIQPPVHRRLVTKPRSSPIPARQKNRFSYDAVSPESLDDAAPLNKDWSLPSAVRARSIGGLDDCETLTSSSSSPTNTVYSIPIEEEDPRGLKSPVAKVQAVMRGANSRNRVRIVKVPHELYSPSSSRSNFWKPPRNWLSSPGNGTL